MSTIRPLATIAVLAAVGVFLVLKINEGGPSPLEGGFGLEPAEVSMVTGDEAPTSEAPLFEVGPAPQAAPSLTPPTFTDPTLDPPADDSLLGPEGDTPTDTPLPQLPELPELPPIEGRPAPDDPMPAGAVMAGAAMAAPAAMLDAPAVASGGRNEELSLPANVPQARYGQPAADPAPPAYATPPAPTLPESGTVTGSVAPEAAPGGGESPAGPAFQDYAASETTPLSFAAPATADPSDADWQAAQVALAQGDLPEAHRLLSPWRSDERVAADRRAEIDRLVAGLAGTLIYDSREHRLAPPHQVQPGETLETIAAKYQVPWRLLAKINGVATADGVQPGQSLKVVQGPFSAIVDARQNELVLMLGDRFAGRFEATASGLPADAATLSVTSAASGPQPGVVLGGAAAPVTIGPPTGRYGGASIVVAARDAGEISDILSVGSKVTIRR